MEVIGKIFAFRRLYNMVAGSKMFISIEDVRYCEESLYVRYTAFCSMGSRFQHAEITGYTIPIERISPEIDGFRIDCHEALEAFYEWQDVPILFPLTPLYIFPSDLEEDDVALFEEMLEKLDKRESGKRGSAKKKMTDEEFQAECSRFFAIFMDRLWIGPAKVEVCDISNYEIFQRTPLESLFTTWSEGVSNLQDVDEVQKFRRKRFKVLCETFSIAKLMTAIRNKEAQLRNVQEELTLMGKEDDYTTADKDVQELHIAEFEWDLAILEKTLKSKTLSSISILSEKEFYTLIDWYSERNTKDDSLDILIALQHARNTRPKTKPKKNLAQRKILSPKPKA